jgi:toxin ParE1/3/4
MLRYRLLREARNDLAAIADYTIERFGIDQARTYRDKLEQAFVLLSERPLIGSDQSHIKPGIRRFVHESHAIYYRIDIDTDEIIIYRLLGPGQDPFSQLKEI